MGNKTSNQITNEDEIRNKEREFNLKLHSTKYGRFIDYCFSLDIYSVSFPVGTSMAQIVGYYKTLDEAQESVKRTLTKLYGECENPHLYPKRHWDMVAPYIAQRITDRYHCWDRHTFLNATYHSDPNEDNQITNGPNYSN
ncbi:MAG: hypothetical protein EOO46_16370 [Flavobacterium sp.]|nr:MAG: hypothetical protein EOO46_16370 [Flavobacterium sp.]